MQRQQKWTWATALTLAGLATATAFAPAAKADTQPRLYLNQTHVEDATSKSTLDVQDMMGVLKFVLGSLPDRVKVYPTENYFYFQFYNRGIRYAGNLRLDVTDRDEGKVHFAYFEDLAEYVPYDEAINHRILDAKAGVRVEKEAPLVYRISYGDKSVVFELNDLSQVKPPPGAFGPDETFIGPIFDESAIRFYLIFNKKLKLFHYVLDETTDVVADQFVALGDTDRILLGKRTGFAFYRDHKLDRKILIGVFAGNSRVNNYFDGPFDQLPDNFIEGETLREAIIAVEPRLKGKIDRYGITPGSSSRYMIGPYRHYRYEEDLMIFHQCATDKKVAPASYYACFVYDEDNDVVQAKMRRGPSNPAPKR